jgi:TRAP-type C4-dicarboxylate transport system permease large subunit
MTVATLFTVLMPVALGLVLATVLFGGRLAPVLRTRVERAVTGVAFPLFVAFWIWRSLTYLGQDNLLMACLMAVVAGIFAVEGVKAFRRGRVIASRLPVPS